jgi:hypothetical protein
VGVHKDKAREISLMEEQEHIGVSYEEDKCLITLFCKCEDCSMPLAEFNNGCECEGWQRRKYDFIGFNGISEEEARKLLHKMKAGESV